MEFYPLPTLLPLSFSLMRLPPPLPKKCYAGSAKLNQYFIVLFLHYNQSYGAVGGTTFVTLVFMFFFHILIQLCITFPTKKIMIELLERI